MPANWLSIGAVARCTLWAPAARRSRTSLAFITPPTPTRRSEEFVVSMICESIFNSSLQRSVIAPPPTPRRSPPKSDSPE